MVPCGPHPAAGPRGPLDRVAQIVALVAVMVGLTMVAHYGVLDQALAK